MDAPEDAILRSVRRLEWFLKNPHQSPRPVVDNEIRLLVKRVGGLVGPERVRRWMDEVSADLVSGLTEGREPA